MNTEQERADFEAWAQNSFELHRHSAGEYSSNFTQTAWAAWQAGRTALQSQSKANDMMLSGVLRMPFDMAMASELSRMQFYQRAQQALNELEALQSQDREDAARLDWLDSMNAKLNSHYGTTYRWELVLSPHVVRLMAGYGGSGHVAAIDLNDSAANGVPSCREAIDHARRVEGET